MQGARAQRRKEDAKAFACYAKTYSCLREYDTGPFRVSSNIIAMMPCEKWLAWQKSHARALAIYQETKTWPADEKYGSGISSELPGISGMYLAP